eukprot:Rmarinus@m.12945
MFPSPGGGYPNFPGRQPILQAPILQRGPYAHPQHFIAQPQIRHPVVAAPHLLPQTTHRLPLVQSGTAPGKETFEQVALLQPGQTLVADSPPPSLPHCKLWVGKIPATVEDDFVYKMLVRCGPVVKWNRVKDDDGNPKGFGICEYANEEACRSALSALNGIAIGNSNILVKASKDVQSHLDATNRALMQKLGEAEVLKVRQKAKDQLIESLSALVKKRDSDQEKSLEEASLEAVNFNRSSHITDNLKKGGTSETDVKQKLVLEQLSQFKKKQEEMLEEKRLKEKEEREWRRKVEEREKREEEKRKAELAEREKRDAARREAQEAEEKARAAKRRSRSRSPSVSRSRRGRSRSASRERAGSDARERDRERERERSEDPDTRRRRLRIEERRQDRERRRRREEEEEEREFRSLERSFLRREQDRVRDREKSKQAKRDQEKHARKERERLLSAMEAEGASDSTVSSEEELRRTKRKRARREARREEAEEDARDREKEAAEREERKEMEARAREKVEEELRRKRQEEQEAFSRESASEQAGAVEGVSSSANPLPRPPRAAVAPANETLARDVEIDVHALLTNAPLPPPPKKRGIEAMFKSADDDDADRARRRPSGLEFTDEDRAQVRQEAAMIDAGAAVSASATAASAAAASVAAAQKEGGASEHEFCFDAAVERARQLAVEAKARRSREGSREKGPADGKDRAGSGKQAQDTQTLVEKIPTKTSDLFAYNVEWDVLDRHPQVLEKLQSFVSRKVKEYLGAEEPDLSRFVVERLRTRSSAKDVLADLVEVFDKDAETFVVKLWRMLIYETLRTSSS